MSENCARVYGPKSLRMLAAHDSRKQESYRLNRPLDNPSIVTVYLVLFQTDDRSHHRTHANAPTILHSDQTPHIF